MDRNNKFKETVSATEKGISEQQGQLDKIEEQQKVSGEIAKQEREKNLLRKR